MNGSSVSHWTSGTGRLGAGEAIHGTSGSSRSRCHIPSVPPVLEIEVLTHVKSRDWRRLVDAVSPLSTI